MSWVKVMGERANGWCADRSSSGVMPSDDPITNNSVWSRVVFSMNAAKSMEL